MPTSESRMERLRKLLFEEALSKAEQNLILEAALVIREQHRAEEEQDQEGEE